MAERFKRDELFGEARNHLIVYSSLINRSWIPADHLCRIASLLEDVEAGRKKRVIITIPPRHGKSMLCSQFFPAWFMGRNPDKQIICATYGQDLANDFGRKVKDQLNDPIFKKIFNARLRSDMMNSTRMVTTEDGVYVATGVGGAITGRGAHLFLIDDPIKNREEADSQLMRDKAWEWFTSVAYTRLMPGGSVVVIMTRWHEDDIVAHLLEQKHEQWEIINLKAIDNMGRPLWPECFPLPTLRTIEQTIDAYDWSCLYQQEPVAKGGSIFKAEWLMAGLADEHAAFYIGVDPAITQKESGDETAISCIGITYGSPALFEDVEIRYGHWSFGQQVEQICSMWDKYKAKSASQPDVIAIGIEDVAYQRALGEVLERKGMPIHLLRADTDKVRRAQSISHLFSQGRVRVNSPKLKQQLLGFRGQGEKNDLVDAFVHTLRMVVRTSDDAHEKPVDRYAGLDPRSKAFWMTEKGDDPYSTNKKDPFAGLI